jgi:hypothetical protein
MNHGAANRRRILNRKLRTIVAWLSWWLMLWVGGIAVMCSLLVMALIFLGGADLILDVLMERENGSGRRYLGVVLLSLTIGFPLGAWVGVWLWGKLMYKFKFIDPQRIRRMTGRNGDHATFQ